MREDQRILPALVDHASPIWVRWRQSEPKEAERADCDGDVAEPKACIHDQWTSRIRKNFYQRDVPERLAPKLRRRDEGAIAKIEDETPRQSHDCGARS